MLESCSGGDAEAEMLGGRGHRGDEQERIGHRDLRPLPQRRLVGAAVDVVRAEHVGDEEAVEQAAFEEPGKLGPVPEVGVAVRPVRGVAPQSGGLVGHAVHVERVEADVPGHAITPGRRPALHA